MAFDLSDYTDVAERERQFFDQYPDGSLQATTPELVEIDGKRYIVVTVSAYRSPGDPRPGVGSAWEPWPGKSNYTRDSEAMNAETSAAGRALRFLGFGHRASREEVAARIADAQAEDEIAVRHFSPARMKQLTEALSTHGNNADARRVLVELILGHEVAGAFTDLPYDELELIEAALADLEAGRTQLELDEAGAPRIVATSPTEQEGA